MLTKRVLYVDCAPFFGGAQRSLLALADGIRAHGWEPHVAAPQGESGTQNLTGRCPDLRLPTTDLPAGHWRRSVRDVVRMVLWQRRCGQVLTTLCRRFSPTIVHANGLRAALAVPRSVRRPAPMVIHDRDVRAPRVVRALLARRSRAIIAISNCVAAQWRGLADQSKVAVIHNGIEMPRNIEPTRRLPADCLAAILVADFAEWKRHGLFIDAIAAARASNPMVRGLIIGRTHDHHGRKLLHRCREQAALHGLGDDLLQFVTFAEDALPYIAGADVLVSTADREPFGRTVVEALALGKPVVTVSSGGPAEILFGCDAGTVVGTNADVVAQAILSWADPDMRAQVADAARLHAGKFTVRRMTQRIAQLYDELLGDLETD